MTRRRKRAEVTLSKGVCLRATFRKKRGAGRSLKPDGRVSVPSVITAGCADMALDWVGFGYAALVSAGGAVGYVRAGSVMSLVAGLLFGLLAAVGAYLASRNPKNVWLSLGTSGSLTVVMGLRFLNSWKFMPAGLMTLASGLMLAKIIIGMLKRPHKS